MSTSKRGGLKAAFSGFSRVEDTQAEVALLGRTANEPEATSLLPDSYQEATTPLSPLGSLTPRPLLHREPVRQLSFRCPVSLAQELRLKAAFNQLEQQQIIMEGLRSVLSQLPSPPEGWKE